jgi:hypothetical protein
MRTNARKQETFPRHQGYRCSAQLQEDNNMKKASIVAAAMLVGSSAICYAGPKNGASGMAPGTQMNSTTGTSRGASEFFPGDQMKDRTTTGSAKGASQYSPGDRMNDARSNSGKK